MRQKVKRYSRSAISILLTLCMLVSCMTVGIIATDAAKVTADEAVGSGGTITTGHKTYVCPEDIWSDFNFSTDEVRLNLKLDSNPETWKSFTYTDTRNTVDGKKLFCADFEEKWGGADTIQIQRYVNGGWNDQKVPKSGYTTIDVYEDLLYNNSNSTWVSFTIDPTVDPTQPIYSLTGNVTDKYIVGSTVTKPSGVNDSVWWSTYHPELAINKVAGTQKYSITFTTTNYDGIDVNFASTDNTEYSFIYSGTAYDTYGNDFDVTANLNSNGKIESGLYVWPCNGGGSLKLAANTTYTITVDQTKNYNNNTGNPYGLITIDAKTVYANAIPMVKDFDVNTRSWGDAYESTAGGTATASPASGNKNELDPTFTASAAASGYEFMGWYSDEKCTTKVESNLSFSETDIPVTHTYYALYRQNPPSTSYGINVTATGHGSVTPSTGVGVATGSLANDYTYEAYQGATVYFDAIPDDPTDSVIYQLGSATATNAVATVEGNKVKLTNITGNVALTVTFTEKTTYTVTLKGTNGTIKATAYNAAGTQTATASETKNGSIQVPIGGTVKLESGTADSGKEFSNFKLDTGKYKRQANQSTGTSPMTIRPIDDMTAEAVYDNAGSDADNWWIDFGSYSSDNTGNKESITLKTYTGLKVTGFNDDTSATVRYASFTLKAGSSKFHMWDGSNPYKWTNSPAKGISVNNTEYPQNPNNGYANSKYPGQITVDSDTVVYAYAMWNGSGNANKEMKILFSTTKLHGGSSSSIDTTGYQRIYAMDGIRDQAGFGETTITSGSGLLETDVEDAQHNSSLYYTGSSSDDHLVYYFDPNQDISFTVQTKVDASKTKLGVRGFVYNGKFVAAKYDSASGVYYATATVKAGSVVDINGENNNNTPILEVIPVYYNTTVPETELIKMYVDANTIENKFGYNIGYYSWYKTNTLHEIDENYPGQPLMKEGTKYYALVPKHYVSNTADYSTATSAFSGVLFNNLAEECNTHKEVLRSWGCSDMNYQTFDYEDPDRIFEISGVDTIEFVAKFEETDTIDPVHRDGTHWYNSNYNKATNLKTYTASTFPSNIEAPTAANKLNGFELLRNFDNKPVDVYGNVVTENFSNSVFVISVGNQKVDSNLWDTVWMIYDGSNKSFITASANPADFINVASSSQIAALKNKNVYINYEKFLDGAENPNNIDNTGDRIDGRWLYSLSEDDTVAHIRVATLGANNDTLNFMSYNDGGQYARLSSDDDTDTSTKEDNYGSIISLDNRTTKVKAVLQEFSGYEIVGFYQQKTGIQGAAGDNHFSTSKADYNEMERDSRTVAKYTNTRENWIVVVLKPIPPSNILVTHEMYGGDGAHYGAGTFYVKAEALSPSGAVLASSGGFVDGGDGFTFENLNSIVSKVDSADPDDHYKIKVTLRTNMAGTNTLYAWYPQNFTTGAYGDPKSTDVNGDEARGKSGTQDTVYYVDVNDLFGSNVDGTFKYTTLAYYSDIDSAGAVYVTHQKLPTSAADGTFQTKVEVLNSSNAVIHTIDYQEGTVTVPSEYTKQDSGNKLKFYLKTIPDAGANYLDTYSDSTGTTSVKPSGNTSGEFSLAPIAVSSFYENVGTTEQPIWQFKDGANTYNYYSELANASKVLTIKKTVDVAHASETTFPITVEYSTDGGTTYLPLAGAAYTVNGGTAGTLDANGSANIEAGENNKLLITLTGAAAVAKIKVTEGSTTYYQAPVYSVTAATDTTTADGLTGCIAFTSIASQSPVVTITNNIKRAAVKVKKVVQDGDSGTTTFPITATIQIPGGSSQTVQNLNLAHNGEGSLGDLPVGTIISITEGTTTGYELVGVTCDGTYVQTNASAFKVAAETTGTNNGLITVTNKKLHNVTVTKTTDWDDYDSNFRIQILISDDGTNYTAYNGNLTGTGYNATTQQTVAVTRTAVQAGTTYYYDIKKSDNLTIPNLATGTYVKIVETNSTENYNFNSATVENEQTGTETAISIAPKGVQFQVGTTDAAVTIDNEVIRHNVTVTKKTFVKNGSTYTDFPYNDGSTFGVKVLFRLLGNSDASAYVPISGGKVNGTASNPADGIYTVEKNGAITFTGIPKGSFIAVSEDNANISDSEVTKAQRFAFDSTIINSGEAATGANENAKYVKVADADVSLDVRNIVKQTDVTITKTTNNSDTTSLHTIQVHVYKNGKASLTGNDEYDTLTYTTTKDANTHTVAAGGNITIVGGETLTFHYPVGSVVTVKETAPNANFDFSSITVTDAAQGVSGIDDPTTVNGLLTFQTKDAVAAVNITNNIKTKDLTIIKATNVTSTTDAFKIKLYTSTDNTNWTPYTTALKNATGSNTLAASDSEYTIHKGEQWVMQNLPINTYVKIEESDYNSAAGYTFDGMTGGSVTVDSSARTGVVQMTDDKSVTINNNKYHDVTINKVLTNSNNTSAKFKISATVNGTATWTRSIAGVTAASGTLTDMEITAGQSIVLKDVPVGAAVVVSEPTDTTGFSFVSATYSITGSGTSGSNASEERNVSFTMADSNATVTVNNKINDKTFTVKKVTDSGDGSGFGIRVQYKQTNSGADWTDYDGTGFTSGVVTLAHNGTASVSVPSDASVRITETTVTSGYQFVSISDGTNTYTTNGKEFAGNAISNGDTITVNNRKLYQVTLKKSLTSSITNDDTKFTFNYSYTDKDGVAQNGSVNLGNNETHVLSDIPAGTVITVTEDAKAGYSYVDTTVTGGITAGTNNQYTVTGNGTIQVNNSLKTKTLRLKKIVDKTYTADATFPVQVEYLNGSTWTTFGTYNVSNDGTTETSVTLTGVAAESDIRVTENYAGSNYDTTLTKIQVGTGALSAAGTTSTTLTNPANNTLVTFYNYCVRRDVKISKTANYTAAGPFGFTFTDSADGLRYQKYDETDSAVGTEQIFVTGAYTFNLTSGQYIIVKNVPIGTALSVEETNAQGATTTTHTLTGVSGTAGTTTANFTVTNAATQEVAFTNSANKTLTITKTKPAGDNDFTDNTTTFQIQVTKGSNPYTGTAGTDYTADTGVTLENGVFTLKMGQSVVINVQNDEQYEVKEINIDSKYTLTNVSATGSDSDVTNGKHFTIGNDNASVTFTNTIKRHKVTVSKTVTNFDSAYNPDFSITATVTKPGQSATTQTESIKHNGSFEITNLPMGTTVTAAETAPTGFTLDSITYGGGLNSSGVLASDADGTITVTNRLNTKTLKLQKAVTGWDHLPATTFPVTVQYYDNSQWNDYATVNLSTDGTVQNVVLKGVAATARIKVIEDLTGITYCDTTTIKVGNAAAVTGTSTDFDAPADNTTVLITNSAKLSKVTVKKAVSNYDADFATRFPITVNITYPDNTTATVSAPAGGLLHNGEFEITNLPVGTTFTVTETVPAGYTQNADTYTGVTKSGSTYTVGSTDGTVTVNNTLKTKTLKVKKGTVDYTYSNENTFPISVYYWNGTEYVLYTDSETISTSNWTEITLKGVAADAKLKVTEDLPAGTNYDATLTTSAVANGTLTAGGTSSIEFTSAANATPEVTFNNVAKKATVTVKKVITNFVTGDTTAFPITATVTKPGSAATTSSDSLANNATFQLTDLPIGTTIVVNEDLTGISGYTLDRIEGDSNISKNGDTFTVGSANATITVYNRRDTSGFTIKKETDVNNTSDSFKIKIWISNNGTDWTAYTSAIGTFTPDANEAYTIHKNSELTIEGLMANTYIKVQETDGMTSKYTSAVTGLGSTQLETGSDNTTGIVKIGGTGQGITITNTTIKKNVTIHKDVLHYANTTDSFNVNVTLESEEGASKSYNYTGAASGTLTNNTQSTIALKNNETVTIANVPIGTTVTVTEQTPTGRYSFGSIDVANASKDATASTGQTVKFTTNNTTADAAVTIQNDIKTHDIEITKNVLNSTASGVTFPISVSIKPLGSSDTATATWNRKIGSATAAINSLTNMAIGNNESITIYGVPEGAQVVVTEGTTTNFSCYGINATYTDTPISIPDSNSAVDNCTFTVPNSDVDVKVNVAVQNNVNTRQVTIAKHVDDGESDSVTFPIKIEVKKTTDADFVAYNDGSHADGVYNFTPTGTMTITVPLDAQVKVTEQNTIPTGFAFESIVCGSDTVTNAQTYTFTGTLNDTANKIITVNNTKLHKLTVAKTVEGTANTTDTFTFKAYKWNGSAWANETTFTLTAGTSHDAFTNVRKGEQFKVVEVVPDKYTYDTTASKTKVTGADTSTTSYTAVDDTTEKGFQNIVMGTSDVNVTVNNIVKTKTVTISKTADYTGTDTFTFNVKTKAEGASEASNCTYQYKLNGTGETQTFTNGNVTLERDQSIVIYNVPVDTEVTVQETNAGNATSASAVITNAKSGTDIYDSATKTATFTVGATADPSVAFTNSKNKTLTITKTKPNGDSDVNDTTTPFYFEVIKTAGGSNFDGAYTLTNLAAGKEDTGRWDATKNRYTVYMGETITINVQSAEIYTIKEVDIPANYTLTSVTGDGENINESSKTVGKTVTIGSSNASVVFENTIKRANVTVQKLVSDYDSGNDAFPITVSYTKPGMAAATTPYNLKKDATSSELTLPYGTQVTVSETLTGDMAKKYQLATDGIKYTVAGSAQQTGASFTMNDKDVAVAVTNERKPYILTVGKVVSGDNTDSTAFKVNVNSDEQTISQGNPYTYTAYYNDTVTVSETNLPRGYELVSIGNGTTSVTSGNYSTTVTDDTTITVTNRKLPTYTLTLTKDAGSEAGNTEFGITVSSDTANGNYSYRIDSGDAVAFDEDSKVITLQAGQSAVISGLLAGETLSFEETEQGTSAGYTFDHFTVNNVEQQSSVTELSYTVLAGTNNIVVHNVKSAPDTYHYRIEYTYPSRKQYVKTTDAQGNEMQGLGEPMYGDQSYFVEGDLLSNNPSFSSYFNASANDGKGAITQDFIASLPLPKESNFMQDITWDTTQAATYDDFGVVTDSEGNVSYYTAKLKYSVADTSKKTVKFMFPYEYQQVDYEHGSLDDGKGVVYIPTSYSDAAYLGNDEDNWQTTAGDVVTYQNEFIAWKVESRLKENSETEYETYNQYYHTTAPSTIKNGGDTANFLYWSIRSKNKSTGNYEEIARSHNPIFNYTIFDDYLIIPVYSCFDSAKYDLSGETEFNASKTAWLNLLDITRNQWNNDARGTESTSRHGKDTIYVDFDLAFCFNGYQLNKKTNAVDTGLLIEDCGELDAEHQLNLAGDATTYKNDVVYYQGKKAEDEDAIKTFIRGNLVKGGVGSRSGEDYIKYTIGKSLTNKNRMELGVINTVRAIEESEEDHIAGWTMTDETKRTHVFRAYSYVTRTAETGDTAVYLSEPVYFTLKNISEM